VDFKAGLRKVSPTPEVAKSQQGGGPCASSSSSQIPPPDFKSQLKKTSKSSGLYGPTAAAAEERSPSGCQEEEAEAGFLGFKSQLRKVAAKPSETPEAAGSPNQSEQFR
jgi:hypothetical protein